MASRAGRRGHVDGVIDGWLRGWAYDAAAPGVRAIVAVSCGAGAPVLLVADRYRADVQAAGHGDGVAGFAVRIDPPIPDRIVCRWADSGAELQGSPWRARKPPSRVRRIGTLVAMLDRPAGGVVAGAVIDSAVPLARRDVVLRRDGTELATARACLYRADTAHLGGDGFHGFRLERTPGPIDLHDTASGLRLFRLPR